MRLQHFIAYVHGAANQTALAGPAPWSNYAMHACECLAKNGAERVLVRRVVPAHDVCNATYHNACPTQQQHTPAHASTPASQMDE